MSGVTVEHTTYEGWEHCIRITNGHVELVVTTVVGPRVVHFGFVDGRNELFLDEDTAGATDREEWTLYGGHRLWHAPENDPRTFVPDNDPVEYELTETGCVLTQPTEADSGMEKTVEVSMAADAPSVTLDHRITNDGVWPVEFAPWAVTVLEPGGTGVAPLPQGDPDLLLPDRSVTFWPDADPGDDRLEWVEDHLLVRHDDGEELKVGTSGTEEWTAYVNDGHALLKSFAWDPEATYPDMGCAVEMFQIPGFFELETLGPKATADPGETLTHEEQWTLIDGVDCPETGEDARALALARSE
ncbi:hypothetical protein GJ629_03020 [Halapricum sp. CBA1109]|uniref:hypothetical protein n=1 Tax=Halapricum sp. CBA1109 TaxID=2668068 RepID=UPI0012F9712B|nr:hypothetical protein [Halapricum sp. CBA1109]MUV88988.1 hypothetical protein [Halapricum sp. CBA1109]